MIRREAIVMYKSWVHIEYDEDHREKELISFETDNPDITKEDVIEAIIFN